MLTKRLQTIANLICKSDNVIDIGCDHGYLSIYLAKELGCKNIIASDINKNALNSAINNIKKQRLENKITTIISDGLCNIDTANYNTIVISGMGTNTIINILSNKKKLKSISKIIIQSNNDQYMLRKKMQILGYKITNEKVVFDNKKYYVIIEFKPGTKKYNNIELEYGPILTHDINSFDYYNYLIKKNYQILKLLPTNKLFLRYKMKLKIKKLNKIVKNLSFKTSKKMVY